MTPKWKFWSQARKSVVVCFPVEAKGQNDVVRMLSNRLPAALSETAECYEVDRAYSNFAALRSDRGEEKLASLIIFAHPDDLIRDLASDFGSITADWWSSPPYEFGIVVAHVCQGYRVMSSPSWTKVFPRWVTYTINVDTLLLGEDDDELWTKVGKAIAGAANRSQKPSALKQRLRSIFYDTIADLYDNGGPKAYVHSLHLQAAMDALISSDEMPS